MQYCNVLFYLLDQSPPSSLSVIEDTYTKHNQGNGKPNGKFWFLTKTRTINTACGQPGWQLQVAPHRTAS